MRAEVLDTFFKTAFGLEGLKSNASAKAALTIPVLLCHAVDDEMVDIELKRQACAALKALGMEVEWKEYQDGGHWINEPQGHDDILAFLARESN